MSLWNIHVLFAGIGKFLNGMAEAISGSCSVGADPAWVAGEANCAQLVMCEDGVNLELAGEALACRP